MLINANEHILSGYFLRVKEKEQGLWACAFQLVHLLNPADYSAKFILFAYNYTGAGQWKLNQNTMHTMHVVCYVLHLIP